jgi:uncharacterized protein (TIGR02217 family)
VPIFPTLPGLGWSVEKRPVFSTQLQVSRNARESRVAYWTYPQWRFQLRYEFLRDSAATPANQTPTTPAHELRELMGFFLARRGRHESFWFQDPTAYQIADAARQTVATGNGTQTDFAIPVAYGGFVDLVGAVNTMALYVNGALQTAGSAYSKNVPYDGWVRFASPPANGAVITWSGSYYYKVRFGRDDAEFDLFMADLWELRTVELVSVRP